MELILKNAHEVCEREDGRLKNLTIKDLIEIRNKYGEPDEIFGDPVEAVVFDHYCYECNKCGQWSISPKEYKKALDRQFKEEYGEL